MTQPREQDAAVGFASEVAAADPQRGLTSVIDRSSFAEPKPPSPGQLGRRSRRSWDNSTAAPIAWRSGWAHPARASAGEGAQLSAKFTPACLAATASYRSQPIPHRPAARPLVPTNVSIGSDHSDRTRLLTWSAPTEPNRRPSPVVPISRPIPKQDARSRVRVWHLTWERPSHLGLTCADARS
jgi:hypothetical protein